MRTLFFDLDGTLIDSAVGITRCVAYSLERMGHPGLPDDALRGWIGPALRVSYGKLFDAPADIERAVALYRERYDVEGWAEHTVHAGSPLRKRLVPMPTMGRRTPVDGTGRVSSSVCASTVDGASVAAASAMPALRNSRRGRNG